MNAWTIRPLNDSHDYDALIALWDRAGLPYEPQGRESRTAFTRQLKLATHRFLVAEVAGHVVGAVLATHDGRKGWINRLAVEPAWRGRGVARALVTAAETFLKEAGIGIVAALVETPNPASEGLFRALGYLPRPDILYFRKPFSASDEGAGR